MNMKDICLKIKISNSDLDIRGMLPEANYIKYSDTNFSQAIDIFFEKNPSFTKKNFIFFSKEIEIQLDTPVLINDELSVNSTILINNEMEYFIVNTIINKPELACASGHIKFIYVLQDTNGNEISIPPEMKLFFSK